MEVSKLTISKDLRHQTSSITKLMLWMQKNPKRCRQTSARALLNTFLLDKDTETNTTFLSPEQMFHKAMKKGLIERRNGIRKADFFINYYHPDLPAQVREARDENEDNNGPVLVTVEAEPKPEPEPEEQADEPHTIVDVDRKIREEIAKSGAPGTEEPEPIVSEPIGIKAGDGEIKLSITLNINITR